MISKQIRKSVSREQGFTLVELMIVIIIIGIMIGGVVVAYLSSVGNTDARGAAEMLKQDLRRVYDLASAGDKPPGVEDYRYQYSITFNGNGDSPPNSYVINQGTPTIVGSYNWAPMAPDKRSANKVVNVSGVDYIQPWNTSGTRIEYSGSDFNNRTIYFVSFGAITLANTDGGSNAGGDMKILVKNGGTTRTVTISGYGNISE